MLTDAFPSNVNPDYANIDNSHPFAFDGANNGHNPSAQNPNTVYQVMNNQQAANATIPEYSSKHLGGKKRKTLRKITKKPKSVNKRS